MRKALTLISQALEPALDYMFSILKNDDVEERQMPSNLKGAILFGLGSEIVKKHPEAVTIAEDAVNPQNVVHKLM